MLNLLKPKQYEPSIFHIDLRVLKEKNIRGVIIDIDDTLVEWHKKYASEKAKAWLKSLENEGFKVCLVSNNTEDRVVTFNEQLKLPAIHRAVKPRGAAFMKAMSWMNTTPDTTAVIGDQMFTDILGGNRMKLYTILVVPTSQERYTLRKLMRQVERMLLSKFYN
ncbi:MAG: YqeG family HAD IIIA-type phosphatase [Bacillota bacterium]